MKRMDSRVRLGGSRPRAFAESNPYSVATRGTALSDLLVLQLLFIVSSVRGSFREMYLGRDVKSQDVDQIPSRRRFPFWDVQLDDLAGCGIPLEVTVEVDASARTLDTRKGYKTNRRSVSHESNQPNLHMSRPRRHAAIQFILSSQYASGPLFLRRICKLLKNQCIRAVKALTDGDVNIFGTLFSTSLVFNVDQIDYLGMITKVPLNVFFIICFGCKLPIQSLSLSESSVLGYEVWRAR